MRLLFVFGFFLFTGPLTGATAQTTASDTSDAFVSLDPRFDALVPEDAVLEQLADGFSWSEGPVWDHAENRLLFSDVPNNVIYQWSDEGGLEVFQRPSGYTGSAPFEGSEPGSNGLTFDAEGRLVICQHGDRRVARLKPDRSYLTLADRYDGRRFNSPNDLVYHSNGDLYFTDPPYGLPDRFDDPSREIDVLGVYRLTPEGEVRLLTGELSAPNGLAFSPDERTLYVANSDPERAIWMAYDVQDDGTLAGGRVFFDATDQAGPETPGMPDGLKVDRAGNLFATGPGGVLVFAPDGTHLGTIRTGVPTANVGWGPDESTLYITAYTTLRRVRLR